MTGPPSIKEPEGGNYLCILETSSTADTQVPSSSRCLLTLPAPSETLHGNHKVTTNTINVDHNPVSISDKKIDKNVVEINALDKSTSGEARDEKSSSSLSGQKLKHSLTEKFQKHPIKHNCLDSNSDKAENKKKVGNTTKNSTKKQRRCSTNKSINEKQSSPYLSRKSNYIRRTSRLCSYLKLPVLTPHSGKSKPRGSLCSVTVHNASPSELSRTGGDLSNDQSALVVPQSTNYGRSGCIRTDGRGRNGSYCSDASSSLCSLLLKAPSSSSGLSSSSSPTSLSPSLSSSVAFSFTSSPQSTSLCTGTIPPQPPLSSTTTAAAVSSVSSSNNPANSSLSLSSLLSTLPLSNHNNKTKEEFSFIVRGRGLSRAVDESHPPIETIVDDDLLNMTYVANIQKAYESQLNTPCSSGHTSPTIKESQSPLSVSHGGWTTGNTTERSSLDSSYSLDDFDKQAATTVGQHFTEIESLMFEGYSSRENSTSTTTPPHAADVFRECQEWVTQFPHLRVLGKQACPSKDTGFYHVPSSQHVLSSTSPASRPTSSLLLTDATDFDLNTSTDSQGLSLQGQAMNLCRLPLHTSLAEGDRGDLGALPISTSSSSSALSSFSPHPSSLAEEVIEEDGVYEDIIAVDYKNIYEENMENKKQITPRRRREGFPPITPNACVKDSVTSGAFDHIWQEVMSWMRQLLMKYTAEVTDSKLDVISFSPIHHTHQTTPASREHSFIQNRQPFPMQRSHTHVGSSTDRSIDGILQISSMPLQTRNQLGDVTESQVLVSNRPGSSFNSQHPSRPMSTLRSQRGARGGRLAPLGDRIKTPNTEEERPAKAVAMDALRVRRLPTISDPLPSPNFHRNGALPPLEMERTPPRKLLVSNRASSAIDKDMRFLSMKDKAHFLGEQARPNTTHTMRSETPFGGIQNRRSSTPLGTSINARNNLLAKQALDVRGNSLQVVGGVETVAHFHPDILEDTQEGPVDEVIRTHWNPAPAAQVSHGNPYRRGKTSIR